MESGHHRNHRNMTASMVPVAMINPNTNSASKSERNSVMVCTPFVSKIAQIGNFASLGAPRGVEPDHHRLGPGGRSRRYSIPGPFGPVNYTKEDQMRNIFDQAEDPATVAHENQQTVTAQMSDGILDLETRLGITH